MPTGRFEVDQQMAKQIEKVMLPTMPSIMKSYYLAMRAEGKSVRTLEAYLRILREFILFNGDTSEDFYKRVTPDDVNRFVLSKFTIIKEGVEVASTSLHRAKSWYVPRSFFNYLYAMRLIPKNPVLEDFRPKQTREPKIDYLTRTEINTMLAYLKDMPDVFYRMRDTAIFVLAVTTGLRVSAIVCMNIEDIDFKKHKVKVVEKGNKEVTTLLSAPAERALKRWIKTRNTYFPTIETNAVFVTMKQERLSRYGASDAMVAASKASIRRPISAHVLRHTCATLLYEETGDIYLCSQQLNHSNINTTQIYATVSDEKKKLASEILNNLFK